MGCGTTRGHSAHVCDSIFMCGETSGGCSAKVCDYVFVGGGDLGGRNS